MKEKEADSARRELHPCSVIRVSPNPHLTKSSKSGWHDIVAFGSEGGSCEDAVFLHRIQL